MAEIKNFLDLSGVNILWSKIKLLLADKVDKETGKGLSSNDYTSDEKAKLANVSNGAQVNVLEGIQKNGTTVIITNKIANIEVPTKTSDITNDSGFITTADIPEGSAASTTTPLMDGTATVGTELAFARGDHRHPSDSTKVDKETGKGLSTNDFTDDQRSKLDGINGYIDENNAFTFELPDNEGNSTEYTLLTYPVLTTAINQAGETMQGALNLKANNASPNLTGTPTAPTATAGTNTDQIATTKFVTSAISTAIGDLAGIEFSIVNSLPVTGDASIIYLVSASDGSGDDVYDEYVWLAASATFEKIGSTRVDLSNYYNKEEVDALVAGAVTFTDSDGNGNIVISF